MSEPRVLVGILNFNAVEDCVATAESLRALDYPAFDLVVVDNASTNEAATRVPAACPWLKQERNAENRGFTGGVNSILDRAAARGYAYALVANNDIAVEPHALSHLVATAQAHPDAAIVGCVEIGWHTGAVRCTGGARHTLVRSRTVWATAVPAAPTPVAFVQGALFLVEVAAVRAGLRLDERLFMYYEEADLGFRLRAMGRTAWVDPSVRVRHKADARQYVPRGGYLQQRNRLYLVRTHGTRWQFAAHVAYAALLELPVKVVTRVAQGRGHFARACVGGFLDGVRGRMGPGAVARW